jgi:hypothetical protein
MSHGGFVDLMICRSGECLPDFAVRLDAEKIASSSLFRTNGAVIKETVFPVRAEPVEA